MLIEGKCHCGNVGYSLLWPDDGKPIPARVCTCTFCTKHGGTWTSHRHAQLCVRVRDSAGLHRYRFGTQTAEFHVCARCGVVPFATAAIEGQLFAVVNVNTFESLDPASLSRSTVSFDGEETGDRVARRKRNWIGSVHIGDAAT